VVLEVAACYLGHLKNFLIDRLTVLYELADLSSLSPGLVAPSVDRLLNKRSGCAPANNPFAH